MATYAEVLYLNISQSGSGSGFFRLTRIETCGHLCPWWASCPQSDFGSAPSPPSDPVRRCLEESCRAPETWCSQPEDRRMIWLGKGVSCSTFCEARVNVLALALLAFHCYHKVSHSTELLLNTLTHAHLPCIWSELPSLWQPLRTGWLAVCIRLQMSAFSSSARICCTEGERRINERQANQKSEKSETTTVCLNEAPEMIWSTSYLFYSALLAAEEDERRRAGDTESTNVKRSWAPTLI